MAVVHLLCKAWFPLHSGSCSGWLLGTVVARALLPAWVGWLPLQLSCFEDPPPASHALQRSEQPFMTSDQ